jgi:[protein-PII] uridylyltransferase
VEKGRAVFEDIAAFAASMPVSYRRAFDPVEVASHAAIVAHRGAKPTHVEAWDELPGRVVAVCVVADDRPGLLAQISTALVAQEVDVVRAHGYTRVPRTGKKEAVDFLWLRRVKNGELASIDDDDLEALGETIDALVTGDASFEPPPSVPTPRGGETKVIFARGDDGGMVLTVEATDRPGLLLAVTQTLFRAGLQIVGVRATSEQGRAMDRFEIVEHDGSAVGHDRVLTLQIAVLTAIDGG